MKEYPEHEKMMKVKDESQAIGEFLDNSGYTLCKIMYRAPFNGIGALSDEPTSDDSSGRYVPVSKSITQILADYFGIDLEKIEAEKREMLEDLRAQNA